MLTPKDVMALYDKYEVQASKRFGQNFLVDHNVLNKIIEGADIQGKDVIEIGPGLGSLTIPLLQNAKSVTSYEIDEDMIRVLNGEIVNPNFHLIKGDFLEADFTWEGRKDLVANIPYNITSDILFKLFANSHKFHSATLMMQKEVAERLVAPVGSSEYGKLTISTQIFADVKKVVIAKPQAFIPAPKVTSMVVKLTFNDVDFADQKKLLEFIKLCFAQRRKTLFNNLKNIFGADKARALIETMKLKDSIRPQELSKDQFVELFNKSNA